MLSGNQKVVRFVIFVLIFSALFGLNTLAEELQEESMIICGKEIPDFEFAIINTRETITKEQLYGKVYILDFWRTNCPRCQKKMLFLQDLFQEFKKEGLVIISLSLDRRTDDIQKFREDKWPMPWIHVWVKDGWNDNIVKTFEVSHLPKMIIIGPNKKIICTNTEQNDEEIRIKLQDILNKK
jgi:alkyl hydroperoxide reductase subunit AhpC